MSLWSALQWLGIWLLASCVIAALWGLCVMGERHDNNRDLG